MLKTPNVLVVGSINIDLVTESFKFPEPGETIMGKTFTESFGGKGGNQAVAAAKLNANVHLIGCLGQDSYGERIKKYLKNENVNIDGVKETPEFPTGIAHINTSQKENKIVVIPGANSLLDSEHLNNCKHLISQADIIVTQLEIPISTISTLAYLADTFHIPLILNPAPAMKIPEDTLKKVSYLTPNESELQTLTKSSTETSNEVYRSMKKLNSIGIQNVIVTRGKQGVVYSDNNNINSLDAINVDTIDSTGAGDTFNGALAVAIAKGQAIHEAVLFANKAAALSTTKHGAQAGMPSWDEMEDLNINQL